MLLGGSIIQSIGVGHNPPLSVYDVSFRVPEYLMRKSVSRVPLGLVTLNIARNALSPDTRVMGFGILKSRY